MVAAIVGFFYVVGAVTVILRCLGCASRTFLCGSGLLSRPIDRPGWMQNVFFHYHRESGIIDYTTPVRLGVAFVYAVGEIIVGVAAGLMWPVLFVFSLFYLIDFFFHWAARVRKHGRTKLPAHIVPDICVLYGRYTNEMKCFRDKFPEHVRRIDPHELWDSITDIRARSDAERDQHVARVYEYLVDNIH